MDREILASGATIALASMFVFPGLTSCSNQAGSVAQPVATQATTRLPRTVRAIESGPRASIMDLGTLGGRRILIKDVSGRGDVVGSSTLANGTPHAFLWRGGHMRDLRPAEGESIAMAVNSAGTVAGVDHV